MKKILLIIFFGLILKSYSQEKDTMPVYVSAPVTIVNKDFIKEYNRMKPKVIKVYPYALYAADLIDKMNNDLVSIEKRRKQKKYCKESYANLKEDFKYVLMDMYTSEGKLLIKLIHRETHMTVFDIINTYKGKKDAMMFNLLGNVWGQDLKSTYDIKKDYVVERIIKDIESGKLIMNHKVETFTKEEYKEEKKETKKRIKSNKKKIKENRKKKRQVEKKSE